MAEHAVLVGEYESTAEIDDVDRADWHGTLRQATTAPVEGDVTVRILGHNGESVSSARARVLRSDTGQPTVLEGLEPFG